MSKLLILQGIPASGKSTFARKWVEENPKTRVVVNRDSIRRMLGAYWVPSREKLVDRIEEYMIKEALLQEYDVCVDATNLNPKTTKKLEQIGKDSEIIFYEFWIDLEEAIDRDSKREESVGKEVITIFYNKYYENK